MQLYFRLPTEQETGAFMSVGRAMQLISSNVSQKISPVYVGRAFGEMGFRRVKYMGLRGYIVVPRTGDEIAQIQKIMAVRAEDERRGQ